MIAKAGTEVPREYPALMLLYASVMSHRLVGESKSVPRGPRPATNRLNHEHGPRKLQIMAAVLKDSIPTSI
jgi:hypothetical protein